VDSRGTAAVANSEARNYVTAFATAVSKLAGPSSQGEVLARIPAILVSEFDAIRSELWLWDESSGSAYLTHAAGVAATHRRDYAAPGDGPLGKALELRQPVSSASLPAFGTEYADFAQQTSLTYVSVFPLTADGRLIGAIANYSRGAMAPELLQYWQLYAEISGAAAQQVLAARESLKTITQLSLLFEATRLLNSTLDLSELLDLILRIARTEVNADRGTVFLVDGKDRQLWSIVASGLDHQEIRLPFGRGVAGHVAETGETLNVEDAYSLPFFERGFDQKFGYRTKSLLCLPIRHHTGEIVGIIQLLNKQNGGAFTADDVDFLNKLSGHMAMALENARLHREALEKQRMERELEMARTIQRGLLPDAPPVIPGYDISVVNEPCYECGGDYYDFLNLGPQTMLLVVADVEGKGVSSAMVMSNLQATLRALIMHLHSLEVLALSLNEMIYTDTKSGKFLSLFLGLVDTRRNGLHFINAGHVPPILVSGETGEYKELTDGGMVIGLFPSAEYTRGTAKLNPGDVLVCCTDGILEANNTNDDEYGTERLAACVARHRTKPAQGIIDAVLAEVKEFGVGGSNIDDKVLMVVKVSKN
jgi:phosphoserine phosphatase RsbU/P